MTQQKNFRFSTPTLEKLQHLTELYGSQSKVIAIAIDRLYMWEVAPRRSYLTPRQQYIMEQVGCTLWDDVTKDFDGLEYIEIVGNLNEWYPNNKGLKNQALASILFDEFNE